MDMNSIIGIGEYMVSNKENDTITTLALATCVGVTVFCPKKKASGMIHIALPEPNNVCENIQKVGYYATIGIPILLKEMVKGFGCQKEDLIINLYGGANSIRKDDVFLIGQKNIKAIISILTDMELRYSLKEVGGFVSRTIEMEVTTGCINMNTQSIQI